MVNHESPKDTSYSLLAIIVNRGKGSKILGFAREMGARDASCFFGKGTINNNVLKMIELNEVAKEIILIVVPGDKETEILDRLNEKFHFDRPSHGIAFTMPLSGILKIKQDTSIKWKNCDLPVKNQWDYTALFLVVDKGKGESVIQISQDAGYYGGTIIKARGSAGQMNIVLDMIVEPEKEAVLMLMQSKSAHQLAVLLREQLHLDQPNTGILVKLGVSQTIGLFQNDRQDGEAEQ